MSLCGRLRILNGETARRKHCIDNLSKSVDILSIQNTSCRFSSANFKTPYYQCSAVQPLSRWKTYFKRLSLVKTERNLNTLSLFLPVLVFSLSKPSVLNESHKEEKDCVIRCSDFSKLHFSVTVEDIFNFNDHHVFTAVLEEPLYQQLSTANRNLENPSPTTTCKTSMREQ